MQQRHVHSLLGDSTESHSAIKRFYQQVWKSLGIIRRLPSAVVDRLHWGATIPAAVAVNVGPLTSNQRQPRPTMLSSHPLQHARLHSGVLSGKALAAHAGRTIIVRDPHPNAIAIPQPVPVGDYGISLNMSAPATPFSHGLDGVDQPMNYLFVHVLIGMFCLLLLVTWAYRWTQMTNSQLRHVMTLSREVDQRYWMHNHTQLWPWIKKNILYAPLGRVRHNREIRLSQAVAMGTLPSRYHTILLALYLLANIAYCLIIDWSQDRPAVVAELRGRTGVLAAYNLVPTVLFALRNNPLIWLLRISYDTFNLLHRWCARVMVLEAIVHTVMWAVNAVEAGGFDQLSVSLRTSESYTWGMVGSCAFVLIVLVSAGPIRHAFYETFLNGHRSLVLVGLIGVYIHLDAAGLPQLPWVWVCMALWSAEWVLRAVSLLRRNFKRGSGMTKVTVEWLPSEACRVTFDLPRPWRWRPGCHVHAYIPALALWSSHPFSVAWAEDSSKHPPMEIEMEKISQGEAAVLAASDRRPGLSSLARKTPAATVSSSPHKSDDGLFTVPRTADVTSVSLIMRAREGMTRKLYEKMVKRDGKPYVTWGMIEGPYGGHESLSSHGTVILFAGGVGITHCVGYIHHLMLQYQAGLCSTRKILLVWSVPNTEALEWIRKWMDQILRMEHRRDVLRIQLFVTKPRHRGEVISSTGSVQMFPGRCNPQTILEREVPERIGSVGVTVCGPGAFADSVRAACRTVVTDASLDFIEEAFTY